MFVPPLGIGEAGGEEKQVGGKPAPLGSDIGVAPVDWTRDLTTCATRDLRSVPKASAPIDDVDVDQGRFSKAGLRALHDDAASDDLGGRLGNAAGGSRAAA